MINKREELSNMDLIHHVHGGNRVELAGWESVSEHNADISAGGIGMDNWTLTLVRNLAGHQALQAAIDDDWIEIRPLGDEPRAMFLFDMLPANKKKGRPVPALMPTISERETLGWLNPKTFSTKGPGAPVPIQDEIP